MSAPQLADQRFAPIVSALGATATSSLTFSFTAHGRQFRAEITPPSRSGPGNLSVKTQARLAAPVAGPYRDDADAVPGQGAIKLRPESRLDVLGKRLGLNVEVQTGDEAFDAAVYVEHEGPGDTARAVLSSPEVRALVLALLEGCEEHELALFAGTDVTLSLSQKRPTWLSPDAFSQRASRLAQLCDALPPLRPELPPRSLDRVTAATFASLAMLLGALPCCGVALWLFPTVDDALSSTSALAGLALWPLLALAGAALARGRPTGLRDASLIAAFTALGSPFCAVALAHTLNGAALSSPTRQHDVAVLKTSVSSGKQTTYHARLAPFGARTAPVDVEIDAGLYRTLKPGARARLVTREGRLGHDLRVSLTRAP